MEFKLSNLFTSKKNQILRDAIGTQKHVGIMDAHNATSDFEVSFRPVTYAEHPINPSIDKGITFFRAYDRDPNEQAAFFKSVHDAVKLDAIIILDSAYPNRGRELAASAKAQIPEVQTIIAAPLFALNNALWLTSDDETYSDIIEKSAGYDATLVATRDGATFTSQRNLGNEDAVEQSVDIKLPPNIDILLASTDESKAFMAFMALSENPHAPEDQKERNQWVHTLIESYNNMPDIKEGIDTLGDLRKEKRLEMSGLE